MTVVTTLPPSQVGRVVEVVMPRPKSRRDPGARMSVLLSNPDYLLEGFAEKKCTVCVCVCVCVCVRGGGGERQSYFLSTRSQYLGQLEEVPMSADLSNRSFLLAELDEQRVRWLKRFGSLHSGHHSRAWGSCHGNWGQNTVLL